MSNVEPPEVPKYKKKSKGSGIPKTKHKHDYLPCIYHSPGFIYKAGHGLRKQQYLTTSFGTYCCICGKIGTHLEIWASYDPKKETEEQAKKRMEKEMEGYPHFYIDDWWFPKFIPGYDAKKE